MKVTGQIREIKNHSMRLEFPHAFFQEVIELDHSPNQSQLFGERQPLDRDVIALVQSNPISRRLLKNTRDPRVSVLDIKNRILAGLALRQIQIEIEMTVRLTHQEEKSRRVPANFIQNLFQRDKLAATLPHTDWLPTHGGVDPFHPHA